jgi:guanidinoacetate N-methyltransferase
MESYDGIFFHTYPLNEEEYQEQVTQSVTFAAHFFDTAARHLNPGGAFTYLTNERDSLSRAHQRLLLSYFSSFSVSMIRELDIPDSSRDAHWSNQMALVKAVK